MFKNILGQIGSLVFSEFDIGGISFRSVSSAIGRSFGNQLDDLIFDDDKNAKIRKIPNLDTVTITQTDRDNIVPFIYGTVRVGGQIIWTSPMGNAVNPDLIATGAWGIIPDRSPYDYTYSVSVAVALCEGEIDRVTNIYVNDRLISSDITTRLYQGTQTQTLDPLIASIEGSDYPAFRNAAYIVIENIPIELFGRKIPNFSFDVVRASEPKIESKIKSLCMIPASGEFIYGITPVKRDAEFAPQYENLHTQGLQTDFAVTVDTLAHTYPNLKNISLVVGWFFNHTDPLLIDILPGVEERNKITTPYIWSVAGYNRSNAWLISHDNNKPAYGGTPSDTSVTEGIIRLYEKGYKTTFYPFLFGDVTADNPDNIPAYPWRGRIKPTGSNAQKIQGIDRFFLGDGASDGYNAMILHYANLCKSVNDQYPNAVDLFIIGSELRELTHTKVSGSYPAITHLKSLASQVRSILGAGVKITYACDWSEDGIYNAPDGTADWVMDNLWSDPNIDYVAYDWYAPLTDWREGDTHLDRQIADYDRDSAYLASRIEGGEGYDWYYPTDIDRDTQNRVLITDGAYSEPWIYRIKDIRNRWHNLHYNRDANGVRATNPTSWMPQSKPIIFTELGCPAVNKGGNMPNLFPDPKSSENALPYASTGERDDLIQRHVLNAYLDYWASETTMIDTDRTAIWCIDARPYPVFPMRADIWGDGVLYPTGHWIDGRGGGATLKHIFTDLAYRAGINLDFSEPANRAIDGFYINQSASLSDILQDLVDVYDLCLTNHNNIAIVTNGSLGKKHIIEGGRCF